MPITAPTHQGKAHQLAAALCITPQAVHRHAHQIAEQTGVAVAAVVDVLWRFVSAHSSSSS